MIPYWFWFIQKFISLNINLMKFIIPAYQVMLSNLTLSPLSKLFTKSWKCILFYQHCRCQISDLLYFRRIHRLIISCKIINLLTQLLLLPLDNMACYDVRCIRSNSLLVTSPTNQTVCDEALFFGPVLLSWTKNCIFVCGKSPI